MTDKAAKLVDEVQKDTRMLSEESYKIIRSCVGYHYGLWSSSVWKKPLSSYTMEELAVYIADYVSSKRFVEVDYRR